MPLSESGIKGSVVNMAYNPSIMSPLDLALDIKNPRFLSTQPTQEKAIEYLLEYGKVVVLAKQIINVGGLFPGERVVVFKENNNKTIVLEGNRRVCACQLLLNPSLIPDKYSDIFPKINPSVEESIKKINVDIIDSREEADSFLTSRHIDGVEKWDPLAKWKFFEGKFASGLSLTDIENHSNYPRNEIKTDITKYYLFMAAYGLSCWTEQQKQSELNLFSIEVDRFSRIFDTRGAKKAFKLSFNANTLQPESKLPGNLFEKILERIMYCAYITINPDEKIDTRTKSWKDVPGIMDILGGKESEDTDSSSEEDNGSNASPESETGNGENEQKDKETQTNDQNNSDPQSNGQQDSDSRSNGQQSSEQQGSNQHTTDQHTNKSQPCFMELLTWNEVDVNLPENQGLLNIAQEIKRFSSTKNPPYKQYPIAATVLLRSLLEQALKYYLRKTDSIGLAKISQKYDPSLSSLISYYKGNGHYKTLIPDQSIQRVFSVLFDTDGLKNFLDLVVHQPNYVSPSPLLLEGHVKAGLFSFINYLLNTK